MRLEADSISLGYGYDSTVVRDVSIRIGEGDMIGIIGANGSGKSTLLKALCRYMKPKQGTVYLDGKSIFTWNTRRIAQTISVLPQIHNAMTDCTVRELVEYGRYPHSGTWSSSRSQDRIVVERAIRLMKIDCLQHRFLSTLSGGERQRAWIAMSLAQEPKVLLLDEPTAFLDINHQFDLLEMISKFNRELGLSIVMILHDVNQAARYSQHIIVMKCGRILCEGTPEQTITEEVLREAFGIQARIVRDPEYGYPLFIPLRSVSDS